VIGVNQLGCQSQPQFFTITDLNIFPVIDSIGPFCEYDNCITLTATPPGGTFSGMNVWGTQYCPNNGFIGIDPVNYSYTQSGCWFDTTLNIRVYPRPELTPVVDGRVGASSTYHEICIGDSITDVFDAVSPNGGYNEWYHFGDTTISQQLSLTWSGEGIFTFDVVRWNNGCVSNPQTFTVILDLCPSELIYVPNTFTPDGDEHNQVFKPIFTSGFNPFEFNFKIYNRWGEIIWETNDPNASWDGTYNYTLCPDGTYTWVAKFGMKDTDGKKEIGGYITIIK